jgi:hypothetical protein
VQQRHLAFPAARQDTAVIGRRLFSARFDLGWLSCAGHCDRFLEDANPDVISALAERSILRFTVAELSKVSLGFCPAEPFRLKPEDLAKFAIVPTIPRLRQRP